MQETRVLMFESFEESGVNSMHHHLLNPLLFLLLFSELPHMEGVKVNHKNVSREILFVNSSEHD